MTLLIGVSAFAQRDGEIVVSRDATSMGNRKYPMGKRNIIGLSARIISSQKLMINRLPVKVDMANSFVADKNGNGVDNEIQDFHRMFGNFRLFVDTRTIASKPTFSQYNGEILVEFDVSLEIQDTNLIVLLLDNKEEESPENGDVIRFILNGKDLTPRYVSGEYFPKDNISGICFGSFIEIQENKIKAVRTDGLLDKKIVPSTDSIFMSFVLDDIKGLGDMKIKNVVAKAAGTGNAEGMLLDASIFVDGAKKDSTVVSSGLVTFRDLGIIPSTGQRELLFVVHTSASSAPGTIQLSIIDIEIEGAEGPVKVVLANGEALSEENPLKGAIFTLLESGELRYGVGDVLYGDIIPAGAEAYRVLEIRLLANNADLQVKGILLENRFGDEADGRADWRIYNQNGRLLQKKISVNGRLYFELKKSELINIPKDGIISIFLKSDAYPINRADQTGKRVKWKVTRIEAVAGGSGNDLPEDKISGIAESELFVLVHDNLRGNKKPLR